RLALPFGLVPRYLLAARGDIAADVTVVADYDIVDGLEHTVGSGSSAPLTVPAGTLAGVSFLFDLRTDEGPDVRLRRVRVTPPAPVEDSMARYGGVGHHGDIGGPVQVAPVGRFGSGFAFRDPAAEVRIANHPAFALPATASFTVEAFVKPDAGAGDGHAM